MGKRLAKVELSASEVATLEAFVSKGKHSVRKIKRAQILLHLNKGKQPGAIAKRQVLVWLPSTTCTVATGRINLLRWRRSFAPASHAR